MKNNIKIKLFALTFSFLLLCSSGTSAFAFGLERDLTPEEITQAAETDITINHYISQKALNRAGGGKYLDIACVKQKTGDMCGPACAEQIATFLGIRDSSGHAYTQDTIKKTVYWNAGEGTSSALMAKGLNELVGSTIYEFTNTGISNLFNSILYSIDNDYPVIINIKELPNYDRPVSVGHFILATGYRWGMSGSTAIDEVTYNDSNGVYTGTHTITGTQMTAACNSAKGYFVRAT